MSTDKDIAGRLAKALDQSMSERGILPVNPWNKRTLKWLENLGCVVSFKKPRNGKTHFHPMEGLRERGYDASIYNHSALCNIFSYGGRPSGPRMKPFDWVHQGVVVRVRCAGSAKYKSLANKMWMRQTMLIWVPDDLATKILVLGHIP